MVRRTIGGYSGQLEVLDLIERQISSSEHERPMRTLTTTVAVWLVATSAGATKVATGAAFIITPLSV